MLTFWDSTSTDYTDDGCREFESRSGKVYSIQHYVIKFVNDLRQVGGFLWVLRFPPPLKLMGPGGSMS